MALGNNDDVGDVFNDDDDNGNYRIDIIMIVNTWSLLPGIKNNVLKSINLLSVDVGS